MKQNPLPAAGQRRQSLGRRLHGIILQSLSLSLLLAFAAVLAIENFRYKRDFDNELDNLATLIANYSAPALAFNDRREALEGLRILAADIRIVKARLSDAAGQELATYHRAKDGDLDESTLFHLDTQVDDRGQQLGSLELWVDTSAQSERIANMVLVLLSLGMCCLALAWVLSRRLPQAITDSITKLVTVFGQISRSKNYQQRAPYTDMVELDSLVNGFNVMLEEIGNRDEQLRDSRENLALALRGSGEGVWNVDLAMGTIFCDARCHEILRLEPGTFGNHVRNWLRRVHADDQRAVMSALRLHFSGQSESFEVECRLRRGDGGWLWLILHGMCDYSNLSATPRRISGTMMDNNERHQAAEESRLLAAVFQNTHEPVVVIDNELLIQAANQAFTELYGARQEKSGMLLEVALDSAYDKSFFDDVTEKLLRDGAWEGEVRALSQGGGLQTNWLSLARIAGDNYSNYLGTFTRIDQRQKVEDELRYLANYDTLTNLPNRRMFNARLQHSLALAQRHNSRFALCFLDLNEFKSINDTLGHGVGDELLIQVAQRLQEPVRDTDTLARLGGDEFVVLLEHCGDREQVEHLAQRLLATFAEPFECCGNHFTAIASMGIARFPEDGSTFESILSNADLAMYQAKHADNTGHYAFFEAGLASEAARLTYLKTELALAIARNQLHIVLQPKFELQDLGLQSAEVLLRWTHPQLGNVSPYDFIPIAEESGLIESIGGWVLRQAAAQLQTWQDSSLAHLSLAVNVSARQFDGIKLPRLIRELQTQYQIPAGLLELELTESLLLDSGPSSDVILRALKKEGVRISIDDFGTGYSSLQYLSQFPVDYLKIDRSFVSGLEDGERNRAIVSAIITMAEGLNMEVIAEGIETEQQLQQLQRLGCQYGQGYWCSPPLKADEFEVFVSEWQRDTDRRQIQ